MSIATRHAYRFGYLMSEEWQTIRLEVLAKHDACCFLCGTRNLSNDVHHCEYPRKIWDTEARHCVVLCRRCHDDFHSRVGGRINWPESRRIFKAILAERAMCRANGKIVPIDFCNQLSEQ